MYYRNRNLSAEMGAVLNKDNAEKTLASKDIVKSAESLPMGGRPPQGQRPQPVDLIGQRPAQRPTQRPPQRPVQRPQNDDHDDFALMQAMYSGVAKKLLPYVKKTVRKNLYDGSPALRPIGPDRDFVDRMTDEVIEAARRECDEADEICLDKIRHDWNDKQLLYDLAQALVLVEIFLVQRKNKTRQN